MLQVIFHLNHLNQFSVLLTSFELTNFFLKLLVFLNLSFFKRKRKREFKLF